MSAIPTSVGRYQVRDVIGTGAFATVYRAVDDHLDVDVAIKVLAENHSLDPEIRQRFIEEGRRLRRMWNPHVVAVYDLDDTERAQPYLVLEWADRGDLAHRVAERRAGSLYPTPADVLAVAGQLTPALDELRRNHLVHRDLAPKNLLLRSVPGSDGSPGPAASPGPGAGSHPSPSGPPPLIATDERLLLGDLGLAKDLAATSGLTVATGTSGFAPPEQRRSGFVDHRSDVWAASAVVVWLATGAAPGEEDGAQPWQQTLTELDWPAPAVQVLARGLSDAPDRRQADISTWFEELAAALSPTPRAPETTPSATPRSGRMPGRAGDPPRRRMLAAGAVVAALLVGAGLGAVVPGRSGGDTVTTSSLEDGRQRTEARGHGMTVAVEGPAETSVDRPVELSADVEGATSWVWIGPDGRVFADEEWLTLNPRSEGQGTVRLQAFDDENHMVEVTRSLEVVPADAENS